MAIEIQYTLGQLKELCETLNLLVVIKGKKEHKDDYVLSLRKYWVDTLYGSFENIPWSLRFMLDSIQSPMLCKRYQLCKPIVKEMLWESDEYVVEEKIDGFRCLIFYDAQTHSFDFYSRNNSIKTFLPQSYKDSIYLTLSEFKYPTSFILDSELVITNPHIMTMLKYRGYFCTSPSQTITSLLSLNPLESKYLQRQYPLKFVVFDCLFDKENIMNLPWHERHTHAETLTRRLKNAGFLCDLNAVIREHRLEFYSDIIVKQKEGVLFKSINAPYSAKTSRTDDMIKLKPSFCGGFDKDIDAWVTGFIPPEKDSILIEGLVFSCKIQKRDNTVIEQKIAYCTALPEELKKMTTSYIGGKVTLNPSFLGKVATLNASSFNVRKLTLIQPVIQCWRPDKNPSGCEILDEVELRKTLW